MVSTMRIFKKLIKIKGNNNQIISPKCKTNKLYKRSPIEIFGDNNVVTINAYDINYFESKVKDIEKQNNDEKFTCE